MKSLFKVGAKQTIQASYAILSSLPAKRTKYGPSSAIHKMFMFATDFKKWFDVKTLSFILIIWYCVVHFIILFFQFCLFFWFNDNIIVVSFYMFFNVISKYFTH